MKVFFRLVLVSVFLALIAGCSKRQDPNDPKTYQEGLTAYTAQNYSVAFEKFKALAEAGNALAQFNIGVMYHQGQGIAQDDKVAVEWWTKAAEQGHVEAQDNIGLRYGKGQGVPQDWVQAYKWFSIAAAGGNQTAMRNQKVAETRLTPQQIQEGQTLAQEWLAKHKK